MTHDVLTDTLIGRNDVITRLYQIIDWLSEHRRELTAFERYLAIESITEAGGRVTLGTGAAFNGNEVAMANVQIDDFQLAYYGNADDTVWTALLKCCQSLTQGPLWEHCDDCTYIGTFPLRYQRRDHEDRKQGWADLYRSCDREGHRYIVRYGKYGAYSTTNEPANMVYAPIIDGVDRY